MKQPGLPESPFPIINVNGATELRDSHGKSMYLIKDKLNNNKGYFFLCVFLAHNCYKNFFGINAMGWGKTNEIIFPQLVMETLVNSQEFIGLKQLKWECLVMSVS